eukprot:COSAG02_NODE_1827_length_10743_cov_19.183859_3_plen_153_part_00
MRIRTLVGIQLDAMHALTRSGARGRGGSGYGLASAYPGHAVPGPRGLGGWRVMLCSATDWSVCIVTPSAQVVCVFLECDFRMKTCMCCLHDHECAPHTRQELLGTPRCVRRNPSCNVAWSRKRVDCRNEDVHDDAQGCDGSALLLLHMHNNI